MLYEINPFTGSVLPREEYFYANKEKLLAPKLDNGERFGTYGMIVIEVLWYYPSRPGKLYHPVNNGEEASYWLNFYQTNSRPNKQDIKTAYFVPAPDQYEISSFVIPSDLIPLPPEVDGEKWYEYIYSVNEYTTFPIVENKETVYYTGGD